jgi:cell division control protein 6
MDKEDLLRIAAEVDLENRLFASKAYLDNLAMPSSIIGRSDKIKDLLRFLLGYKQGLVVPFISVYGRSGSGKSTIVRYVCENLDCISYRFVNLRKARTVFGCANAIIGEFGVSNLKSAQGVNAAVERIGQSIESEMLKSGSKLFVLVLDEFDVLFQDRRNEPSDFIYKLLVMVEQLRGKGLLVCIVAISNNVMSTYRVDDRVRSRIGQSEVFFGAYSKREVLEMLQERAGRALVSVEPAVLKYCADQSSSEHGDARRAIDLLRVAAEIAGRKNEKLGKLHVDRATEELQRGRAGTVLSSASRHLKLVCSALARMTFVTGEPWHSTSTVYKQYCNLVGEILKPEIKPLGYRRVSELLTELDDTGIAISQTGSRGRHGYGTQYKLTVPPETVGLACFPKWWNGLVKYKTKLEKEQAENSFYSAMTRSLGGNPGLDEMFEDATRRKWEQFVGPGD